jgi:hypothetical protein
MDSFSELWDGPSEIQTMFEEYLLRTGSESHSLFFRQARSFQRDARDAESRRAFGREMWAEYVESGARHHIAFPPSLLQGRGSIRCNLL